MKSACNLFDGARNPDLRLFLADTAPWKNPDTIDGYVDCASHREARIRFWGYALSGVRVWKTNGLDGWSNNDYLRDRLPTDPRFARLDREYVRSILEFRDRDLDLQREAGTAREIEELVTEAMNAVYDKLGRFEGIGEDRMVEHVFSAAAAYVRECFAWADRNPEREV